MIELSGEPHLLLGADGEWFLASVQPYGPKKLTSVTLSRSGVIKTIRIAQGHQWMVRNQIGTRRLFETENLKPGHRLVSTFPTRAKDLTIHKPSVKPGFVYGDGSVQGRWAVANFCGQKDEAILPFFNDCELPRIYSTHKRILHLPKSWKTELPDAQALPANNLYGWLAGYFAADGDVGGTGRPTLASARRDNLEYVRGLCTIIGIGTFGIRTRMRKGFNEYETPLYLLGLMRGDLCPDFFLIPEHRKRFLGGREAAERRGWTVVDVERDGEYEDVFGVDESNSPAITLEDNILASVTPNNPRQRPIHATAEELVRDNGGAVKDTSLRRKR